MRGVASTLPGEECALNQAAEERPAPACRRPAGKVVADDDLCRRTIAMAVPALRMTPPLLFQWCHGVAACGARRRLLAGFRPQSPGFARSPLLRLLLLRARRPSHALGRSAYRRSNPSEAPARDATHPSPDPASSVHNPRFSTSMCSAGPWKNCSPLARNGKSGVVRPVGARRKELTRSGEPARCGPGKAGQWCEHHQLHRPADARSPIRPPSPTQPLRVKPLPTAVRESLS